MHIKNSVIGSNKQKSTVISQGVLPRLVALMKDDSVDQNLRRDAAIVITSLTQGNADHVQALINAGLGIKNKPKIILIQFRERLKIVVEGLKTENKFVITFSYRSTANDHPSEL